MDSAGADALISAAARAKLLVVAVFLIGAVTGALIDNAYETRWNVDPDSRRSQREVDQVYDFLDLTPEQRQQFQSILEASRPDFEKLFEENRKLVAPNNEKIAELQAGTRNRIRAILTEEQVKKYDAYNEKRRQRRGPPPRPK
jgi:Spy/CpxP family protein refolding chaperone